MKILIIGSGGREHALAAAFARHNPPQDIVVMPGNAGIAREYVCVTITDKAAILQWCEAHQPDYVVVGPEQPLAEGISDLLSSKGFACIGPSQQAARIETSKSFAKNLMRKHNIPTAAYVNFSTISAAREHLKQVSVYPLVIKADGLAAGKGVFICADMASGTQALDELQVQFGGECEVLFEEFLVGWEVSLFAICDGEHFQTMLFVQDYKQLNDNDSGPNTGGMGSVCPISEAEPYRTEIENNIIQPTLKAMKDEGCPIRGSCIAG